MAFPDNVPMNASMPGYLVYRDTPPGQPFDPAAPPVFFPPKDSDELFDALRIAFPHVKSHSERMRDAMIKFLVEERQAEQAQSNMTSMPDAAEPSPWLQSFPSVSSSGSTTTFSSPETLDLATPNFGMSPQPQIPQLSRHFSTATSITLSSNGEQSPAGLEGMTGVFSVSADGQPKQRLRRKMTEAEKVEYRKRRIVKACEKCSKRKRKCNHNQPEMENLAAKQKVNKTRATPPNNKSVHAAPPQQVQQTFLDFDTFAVEEPFAGDMQLFDDFTNFFDEPGLEYDYDYDQQKKKFDHMTGMNAVAGNRMMDGRMGMLDGQDHLNWVQHDWSIPGLSPMETSIVAVGMQNTTGGRNLQTATPGNNANSTEALRFDQIQIEADHLRTDYHPHHLYSTINTRGHPLLESFDASIPGMLSENADTIGAQPTHTQHVHDAESQSSYVFESPGGDASGIDASNSYGRPQASANLATSVLQLNGVAKAIRAFGRRLLSNGPKRVALQLVSLTSVANAIAQSHKFSRTGGFLLTANDQALSTQPRSHFAQKQAQIDRFSALDGRPSTVGPLEGMRIADYLRMKTNFDDVQAQLGRGGQALPSCIPGDTAKKSSTYGDTSVAGEGMVSASVPFPRGPSSDSSAAHEGRPSFNSNVEDIETAARPSSEMYMLKRRIPKALHSVVDRDNRESVPTPLLQSSAEREQYREVGSSQDGTPMPTQVNGGAYPRLVSDIDTRLPSTRDQTAPRRSTTDVPGSATGLAPILPRTSHLADSLDTAFLRTTRAAGTTLPDEHALQVTVVSMRSTSTVGEEAGSYVHKKRDTVRYRDHFGRYIGGAEANNWEWEGSGAGAARVAVQGTSPFSVLSAVTTILAGAVLLTGLLRMGVDSSLLFLALCYPVVGSEAPKRYFHRSWNFYSHIYGAMLSDLAEGSCMQLLRSVCLFSGTRFLAEEATQCRKSYFWFDAAWPGTSGEGEGKERRRGSGGRQGRFRRVLGAAW